MDTYKQSQLNKLFALADNLNGLFNEAYQLALKGGCPNVLKQELYENTDALQNSIFRIAQFWALPNAEEFSPIIREKAETTENKLKMCFVE